MDPVLRLLRDLVAIDSVNPSLVPGGAGEAAIADRVATALRSAGLDVQVTEVATGRPNVVGVLEGRAAGRALMFCGHLDTVGVVGMSSPFDPVARRSALWARRAGHEGWSGRDDRRGHQVGRRRWSRDRAVGGAAVADEENASLGADALVRNHAADGAVVTEPTDLAVATGTKDSSGSKSRPAVGPPTAAGRTKGATPSYAWAGSWPG